MSGENLTPTKDAYETAPQLTDEQRREMGEALLELTQRKGELIRQRVNVVLTSPYGLTSMLFDRKGRAEAKSDLERIKAEQSVVDNMISRASLAVTGQQDPRFFLKLHDLRKEETQTEPDEEAQAEFSREVDRFRRHRQT